MSPNMAQTIYKAPLPSANALPSAVRQYLEAALIERFEFDSEVAAKTAAVWEFGDGSELRFGIMAQDPRISPSPSFLLFGSRLGPLLQEYVMAQGFAEWRTSPEGTLVSCKKLTVFPISPRR